MREKDKKKEGPIKKIENSFKELYSDLPPKTPPDSVFSSSIGPSTAIPSSKILPDPTIPVKKNNTPSSSNATSVDKMIVNMGEANLQTEEEREVTKQKERRLKSFEAEIQGIKTQTSDKTEKTDEQNQSESKKNKAETKKEYENVHSLFPGLKAIGKALGLSKERKDENPEEKPK